MLFSSNIFLFTFLPITLLIYFGAKLLVRNTTFLNFILFLCSSFFYFWGSGTFIFYFFGSIFFNYFAGDWIFHAHESAKRKLVLSLSITLNLALLGYFKYWNFFAEQINALGSSMGTSPLFSEAHIFLPIGISFYTFMAISYLVETYRHEIRADNVVDFATYMTMFPHLVAGPIVRYSDISGELRKRSVTLETFNEGILRFAVGLGKKILLAGHLGAVADKVFALPEGELSTRLSWLGILCYTLQIYFDFSGYSDMAIGLARFFGFHFPENFNHPYRSHSITEFWRRWHMTLSFWFRDFLYIPLGGNRTGTYRNLFLVFFLCGLWHGASWHFVVWGLFHGMLLIGERVSRTKFGVEPRGFSGIVYTFFLTMIGWVLFRAQSLDVAMTYLSAMFGMHTGKSIEYYTMYYYLNAPTLFYLLIGLIAVFVPFSKLQIRKSTAAVTTLQGAFSVALICFSIVYLSKSAFTPFIYFQF